VYQIVCRLGLRPRPRWGSLQRSPRPPSWILGGLLLRGRGRDKRRREGGDGREGEEKGKGEGRGGRGRVGPQVKAWPPITIFLAPALVKTHGCTILAFFTENKKSEHLIFREFHGR